MRYECYGHLQLAFYVWMAFNITGGMAQQRFVIVFIVIPTKEKEEWKKERRRSEREQECQKPKARQQHSESFRKKKAAKPHIKSARREDSRKSKKKESKNARNRSEGAIA